MSCEEITTSLMTWAASNTQEIVVPNYYIGTWECDVMKISKAGHMTEYEIKTSRADFKKDADKSRSIYDRNTMQRGTLNKHTAIQEGKRCNRFYFVVPVGLIEPTEVPDGMGLIYASNGISGIVNFKIIKVSRLFKKESIPVLTYQQLARNLSLKLTNQKRITHQWRSSYKNVINDKKQ